MVKTYSSSTAIRVSVEERSFPARCGVMTRVQIDPETVVHECREWVVSVSTIDAAYEWRFALERPARWLSQYIKKHGATLAPLAASDWPLGVILASGLGAFTAWDGADIAVSEDGRSLFLDVQNDAGLRPDRLRVRLTIESVLNILALSGSGVLP